MSDELMLETINQNEGDNTRNENADQPISFVDEKDKKTEKPNEGKNSEEMGFQNSKCDDKPENLIKTNTCFKIEPQAVWFLFGNADDEPGEAEGNDYDPYVMNPCLKIAFIVVFILVVLTSVYTYFVPAIEIIMYGGNAFFPFVFGGAMIVLVPLCLAVHFYECMRSPLVNVISILLALTAVSVICGGITGLTMSYLVLYSLEGTLITLLACIILAYTSFDFSSYYIYIIVIVIAFAVTGFKLLLQPDTVSITLKAFGIWIVIIVALILELQLVLGGTSIVMNDTDYTLAVFLLYTSIINVCITLIQMLINKLL